MLFSATTQFPQDGCVSFPTLHHSTTPLLRPAAVRSRDDLLHDLAVVVREPKIPPVVTILELLVVEAQQRENGRVQVVDVAAVLHRARAELVGGAIDHATLHAAAGHPAAE